MRSNDSRLWLDAILALLGSQSKMSLQTGAKRARLASDAKSDEEMKTEEELQLKEGSIEDDDGNDSVMEEGENKKTTIQIQEEILLQKTVANVNNTVTINQFDNVTVNM